MLSSYVVNAPKQYSYRQNIYCELLTADAKPGIRSQKTKNLRRRGRNLRRFRGKDIALALISIYKISVLYSIPHRGLCRLLQFLLQLNGLDTLAILIENLDNVLFDPPNDLDACHGARKIGQ
jgi:hypothetical protein